MKSWESVATHVATQYRKLSEAYTDLITVVNWAGLETVAVSCAVNTECEIQPRMFLH